MNYFEDLKKMARKKASTRKMKCKICKQSYKGVRGIKSHMRQAHRETFYVPEDILKRPAIAGALESLCSGPDPRDKELRYDKELRIRLIVRMELET